MRMMIIGALSGELSQAARMAMGRGARIEQADTREAALAVLRRDARVDLVLCDLAQDVPALIRALAAERIAVPVVACAIDPDPELATAAIRAGAREFLPLPPDAELIAAILDAVAGDDRSVVVRDPVMQATLRRAEQVAMADASVLVTGDSGTGKEVLARHIHARSRRAKAAFVALNCAAIPENLLESELFGHEKGAFSGAVARRVGKFEAADGGTLLLDEIGEMDIRLQAKLLRALQEREIDRIGGSAPVKVDVRILATTNRDLLAEVAAGRFREDLYFRLNVISLHVPPLRERPQDIQALADHFARRFAEVNGLPNRPLSEGARHRLAGHAWRGNVRELENTLHRAVLLAHGDWIEADSIEVAPARLPAGQMPPQIAAQQVSAGQVQSTAPEPGATGVASLVGRRMEEVERDLILETLHHTLGNRTHAATILGISIRALRNKLRDYSAAGVRVPPPPAGLAAYAAAGEAV
jgi:DNA-binding NtrC family response regulator